MSEGRILAALQDEVTAAEARLEEERAAHTNTQRTAAAQEQVGALQMVVNLPMCHTAARNSGS